MALSSGTRLGAYEIAAQIGVGGMGEVYRALDTRLNRSVAIKFLASELADASARRRFQQEAKAASALNHPHILTVHEAGEIGLEQPARTFVAELVASAKIGWHEIGERGRDYMLQRLLTRNEQDRAARIHHPRQARQKLGPAFGDHGSFANIVDNILSQNTPQSKMA